MGTAVEVLERQGLADVETRLREYLPRQRWFGGRDREIMSLRVVDVGVILEGDPSIWSVVLEVDYVVGDPERFHVPIAFATEGARDVWEGIIVGTGEREGRPVVAYDALHGGEASFAFWRATAAGTDIPMEHGRLNCRNLGFELGIEGPGAVRPLGREQSNSSLVRGDLEVMKCFRKLAGGTSPELEMLEALAAQGFRAVAAPLGVMEYQDDAGVTALVAMLQPYLHNGTDGWTLALASLRDLYGHVEDMGVDERRDAARVVRERGASFEPESERIARVTARMHLALRRAEDPDMRPVPAGPEVLGRWQAEMREDLDRLLAGDSEALEPLRARRGRVDEAFVAVGDLAHGGMSIRYHGDYHLGQLLRTDRGWTVLDFEGEPARGPETRRARSSGLRDVAGMMRSFDYAAEVELRNWAEPGEGDYQLVRDFGLAWARVNRESFWDAYIDEIGESDVIPRGGDAGALCRAFAMQKAVYEAGYELGHRPDWLDIPLNFLLGESADD
ncbi:MAG: hypothetical protein ABR573_00950 [Candidatus Dormibacteria bacterium]